MTIIEKRSRIRFLKRTGVIPLSKAPAGTAIAGLTNEAADSLLIEFDSDFPGFTGSTPAAREPDPVLNLDPEPEPIPVEKPASTPEPTPPSGLDAVIAAAISPHLKKAEIDSKRFDELARESAELKKQIAELAAKVKPAGKEITVNLPDGKRIEIGRAHETFPDLVDCLAAGCHPYLVGPAGSFKTTAGKQAAKALDLPFSSLSVCQQTTQVSLLGYMNATGDYVSTEFRKRYETGGLFLLDEIDNGNANVLAVLNSGISNGGCAFADGMVDRHDDFKLIATANTFGTGADMNYVGRCQLDAATLDRFAFLVWDYDEELEREIAQNDGWTDRVQSIRRAVASLKSRLVVSPRATFEGAALLAGGMNQDKVEKLKIWKGTPVDEIQKIKLAATR